MSSFTISLQPNVDTTVDLVAVQDDGTPIDLRGATVTECVKDGSGALVLTVAATSTTVPGAAAGATTIPVTPLITAS